MDSNLGYQKSERSDSDDYRNGYKSKQVNSSYGSMEIEVPQYRKLTFQPQVVKKRQKDISNIDQKITSMYAISIGRKPSYFSVGRATKPVDVNGCCTSIGE